jgi:ADP-ribosylglycohydrolase
MKGGHSKMTNRHRGTLIGLAIGDALGAAVARAVSLL